MRLKWYSKYFRPVYIYASISLTKSCFFLKWILSTSLAIYLSHTLNNKVARLFDSLVFIYYNLLQINQIWTLIIDNSIWKSGGISKTLKNSMQFVYKIVLVNKVWAIVNNLFLDFYNACFSNRWNTNLSLIDASSIFINY